MQYLFGEMRFFLLTTPSESSAQPLCCGPTPPVNWHIHVFHLTAADWMSAGCWTVDMTTWECFAGQKLVLELSNGHLDTGGSLWFHHLWCTLKLKGWGGIQNKSVYFCAFFKKNVLFFHFLQAQMDPWLFLLRLWGQMVSSPLCEYPVSWTKQTMGSQAWQAYDILHGSCVTPVKNKSVCGIWDLAKKNKQKKQDECF